MRILVVEDNHRLNSSLTSSLVHEGYSVDRSCHFPRMFDPTSPGIGEVGSSSHGL